MKKFIEEADMSTEEEDDLPPFPRGNGGNDGAARDGGAGAGAGPSSGRSNSSRGSGGGGSRSRRDRDEGPAPSGKNRYHPYQRLALGFVCSIIEQAVQEVVEKHGKARKCGCCGQIGFYRSTCGRSHVCLMGVCNERVQRVEAMEGKSKVIA